MEVEGEEQEKQQDRFRDKFPYAEISDGRALLGL